MEDCDDTRASVRPGRDEIPHNGIDDACNGDADEALVFDMTRIADADTAACTFTNHRTATKDFVNVDIWDVSYVSWESRAGELVPILIRGFAARPAGATNVPGVVRAHGLGGFAKEEYASGLAALLGAFVIADTGPGGAPPAGTDGAISEGLPVSDDVGTGAKGYRMFDTITDIRGAWLWAHAVAAMRGLTCLADHAAVDADRLGMTGFSAGGVVTLLAAGADPRIDAAVPLSGTLAMDASVRASHAWQHDLLTAAGLDTTSDEWVRAIEYLLGAPAGISTAPNAKIMMVNGSADEFFPLTAHMETFAAIPTSPKRSSLAGNFDHGCYALGIPVVPESTQTIEDRASLRAKGAQRAWFGHHFASDATYYGTIPESPEVPTISASSDAATCLVACGAGVPAPCVYAAVDPDPGGAALEVDDVELWWSNDHALNWGALKLTWNDTAKIYDGCATIAFDASVSSYFVDVLYITKLDVDHTRVPRQRFSLASDVVMPAGLVPHIRGVSDCAYP